MAYNNRSGHPSLSASSNNLDPSRFAQNPTRNKSTRWTAAKSHNYDGDDWGDDDYGEADYDSQYIQQQQQQPFRGYQYGATNPAPYGNQEFGFSRSSTQPVSHPYSRYETAVDDSPKPLARQGTSPAANESNRYSMSGVNIQRKPSKMDKDKSVLKQLQASETQPPLPPQNVIQNQPPGFYHNEKPQSAYLEDDHVFTPIVPPSQSMASRDPASANENMPSYGYTTPTKQPSSPTQSAKSSPTFRRPAEIYAAARNKPVEPPSITVDLASSDRKQPANDESRSVPDPSNTTRSAGKPTAYIETMVPDAVSVDGGDHQSNGIAHEMTSKSEESVSSPSKEQIASPITHDSPARNSSLFLDVNTEDDINRNIKLVTPPPSQTTHFLTIPEPIQEPPATAYDSDDERMGLFHTGAPPRRNSYSPTSEAGYFPTRAAESPIESKPDASEAQPPPADVPSTQQEAASPSDYGTNPPSSATSPTAQNGTSIAEKVSNATGTVSTVFSNLVSSAFSKTDGTQGDSPVSQGNNTPAQEPITQTASRSSPPAAGLGAPDHLNETPQPPENATVQKPGSDQPSSPRDLPSESIEIPIATQSRSGTPDKSDDDEEVTIEEARTGAWRTATHVAISQTQSPTNPQPHSPVAEISQPLITKVTEPTIHTPQPTTSQIEPPVIIESRSPVDRNISPVSHASSSHSKSPSMTATGPSSHSTERRSPQPTSFADFLRRSPQNTPPNAASGTSTPPATVSFKTFMNNRGNPTPEPEAQNAPAPSFKTFLSQKTPPGQVASNNPPTESPVTTTLSPSSTQWHDAQVPDVQSPSTQSSDAKPPNMRTTESPVTPSNLDVISEEEALRRQILRNLDADSQPQTPDTPDPQQRSVESPTVISYPSRSIQSEPHALERNASYKGKTPQRTASVAISDVSDDQYRGQGFEGSQYTRYQKPGDGGDIKSFPPRAGSDVSMPSKSGDDNVFTPPTRSVAGDAGQEYEPSIQEERGYQPSITSDQYVPSPVDTVHPTQPIQSPKPFNEIPTLLDLSDILALSDAKDRIAASEKARKILAQQGEQGSHDLQVWLQHVQQLDRQNAQLWTYNSRRPFMRDLRSNPLVSGRFDLMQMQPDHGAHHHKWKGWNNLDDGVNGSRPSTAGSNDFMAPKKKPITMNLAAQPRDLQQLQPQNADSFQNGQAPVQQNSGLPFSQARSQGAQPAHMPMNPPPTSFKNPPQLGQVNSMSTEVSKPEEPREGKKKLNIGGKLKGILGGRKKDKGEIQQVEQQSQPSTNLQSPPPQGPPPQAPVQQLTQQPPVISQAGYQPAPVAQNEKYPPNIAQPGPQYGPPVSTAHQNYGQQLAPNEPAKAPRQEEFLPPLAFQQGNKSPGLSAVMNLSSSSVPDLKSQTQTQRPEDAQGNTHTKQKSVGFQPPQVGPGSVPRPRTSGEGQSIPLAHGAEDEDETPPPLRRLSTSKPPPPRKQLPSIPGTIPEASHTNFNPAPPHNQAHDGIVRPGTAGAYPQHGGQSVGQPHLRPQDNNSGYEPSVSDSVTSDHTGKKPRFSIFTRAKNASTTPTSSTTQVPSDNTGSPRHSMHTVGSQPAANATPTEKRNSSFFQNQLKKFDQIVVGKDRANEFHHPNQQNLSSPPPQAQNFQSTQPGPEPGVGRQQSFPTDGSSSLQPTPDSKKKGRFASLLNDLKAVDPLGKSDHGQEEKKSRKPSFFGGKSHQETHNAAPVQQAPTQNWSTAQSQPSYNHGENVVVPIPGQYHSVGQNPHIQSSDADHTVIPPNHTQSVNGDQSLSRKVSNPPPPAARFLETPPSPPPVAKQAAGGTFNHSVGPIEEESIYAPPITANKMAPQPNAYDNAPPPIRAHQTSSPSPPPRIVFTPPVIAQTKPVYTEPIRSPPAESAPVFQSPPSPVKQIPITSPPIQNVVVSPTVISKDKEPGSSQASIVSSHGPMVKEPISNIKPGASQPASKAQAPREEPPTFEITPATATETEPPQSPPLKAQEPTVVQVEATKTEEPMANKGASKKEVPDLDTREEPTKEEPAKEEPTKKEEPVSMEPAGSSSQSRPEPTRIVSNEDFDKIAVDPEGPVPERKKEEDDDRIVMSATTMPGSHDWEYF